MKVENHHRLQERLLENQVASYDDLIGSLTRELESRLGSIDLLEYVTEGSHHLIFVVHPVEGELAVARLPLERGITDPTFTRASIERQAHLYRLFAEHGVNVPKLRDVIEHPKLGTYLLLDYMPGTHLHDYLAARNHDLNSLLTFVKNLGHSLAKIHAKQFDSFGPIFKDAVGSPGITSYPAYLESRLTEQLNRPDVSQVFSDDFVKSFESFIRSHLDQLSSPDCDRLFTPHLILGDHHPHNVLVDRDGTLGFFDLELARAATAADELAAVRTQFCAFYYDDRQALEQSNEALKAGYLAGGGNEEFFSEPFATAELVVTALGVFATVLNYRQRTESYRATWSGQFKQLLENIVNTGTFNPIEYSRIISSKTNQPALPTQR